MYSSFGLNASTMHPGVCIVYSELIISHKHNGWKYANGNTIIVN